MGKNSTRNRRLSDWLTGYIKYTDPTESPKSYHIWTGISMIAAALRRKVFIVWGFEVIYPNFYIVLVGPSGRCRKGLAMKLGRNILKKINVAMTSESITREALIRDMKESVENFIDPDTKQPKFHCSLTAFSPELSVFLAQNDLKFLADLTDWYDSDDEWTYRTKGAGTDTIQGVCFNLLGATASDWFTAILPNEAIGGGFTSRIIFVVEETKRKTVARGEMTDDLRELQQALVDDLERISTMAGEMQMSEEAAQKYADWYEKEDTEIRKGNYPIKDPRFAGYCERRATHLRKLCMIMSASRGNDLYIHSDDFDRALEVLTTVEVKMPRVFVGLGSSPYARQTDKIIDYIKARRTVTRSDLLANFYHDVDVTSLEMIQSILEKMKILHVEIRPDVGEVFYTYIGDRKNKGENDG